MPDSTRPPDLVEMQPGITNLPEEIRQVARLANQAGMEGFEVEDATIAMDEAALATGGKIPPLMIRITYRKPAAALLP